MDVLTVPKKGCLIVFEGIEGSGKSTASRSLEKHLATKGYKVLWTREPTTSKIGNLIESFLIGSTPVAEEAIPLLFAADRADHTKRIIIPALNRGSIVICDRYIHSSLAYQTSGMGKIFKQDWLQTINEYAISPDLVIFLDISPEEGLDRIGKWKRIHDDKFFEDIETQKKIRQEYRQIFNLDNQQKQTNLVRQDSYSVSELPTGRISKDVNSMTLITVDASLKQQKVQSTINDAVEKFLKKNGIEKQPLETRSYDTTLSIFHA
jgi:dTMP kinase